MADAKLLGEIVDWLRNQAESRVAAALSRRGSVSNEPLTAQDRKAAHRIAEQMAGRKLRPTTEIEDAEYAGVQNRIASKLESEGLMLYRFADAIDDAIAAEVAEVMAASPLTGGCRE